jgi:CPA2 family monovalent cation:H+ antiporter-2
VHRVQAARDERYASLRGYFHGSGDAPDDEENVQTRLHSVAVNEEARIVGKPISSLKLDGIGAEITTLRRRGKSVAFDAETILQAGDVVVLRGQTEAVARAEARILS